MLTRNCRKERIGKIVSDKADKTIVVLVERRIKHPIYGKYIKVHNKFMAHDENNEGKLHDIVKIMETRPLSKCKRWRLVSIVNKTSSL